MRAYATHNNGTFACHLSGGATVFSGKGNAAAAKALILVGELERQISAGIRRVTVKTLGQGAGVRFVASFGDEHVGPVSANARKVHKWAEEVNRALEGTGTEATGPGPDPLFE